MPINLDKHNEDVKEWAANAKSLFKTTAAQFGIVHRADSPSPTPSINKFKNRFKSEAGAIAVIGIVFPRTLIYPHKGSGKGMGGPKGSKWLNKYGQQKTTNPNSFGKMGTGNRAPKEFINNVLDGPNGITELADIAAENIGDALVADLFI